MRDYFGYNMDVVMNITDVDDKIIRKAVEQGTEFYEISRKFERTFLEDMEKLNVEPPMQLTRVSEFIPEIIEFIQKIIDNGFGYESNGSVYFDVPTFSNAEGHTYAKLDPSKVNDVEAMREGEGVLTGDNEDEKKSKQDFALWKKSKPGEPIWESPWGPGRPGWHIECSAMVTAAFGLPTIDIHSGGVDLKFPHHDNEIAQSEAYFNSDDWVKYWFHTGHLNIKDLKMSKSLKNFITIKDFIDKYNHREIRMLFLTKQWDRVMNYDPISSLDEARATDQKFKNFFRTIQASNKSNDFKDNNQKWNERDRALSEEFRQKRNLIHHHLCNNFSTPEVITELLNLASTTVQYTKGENVKSPLVRDISRYVLKIMSAMGFVRKDDFGYEDSSAGGEKAQELMTLFNKFRADVLELGRGDFNKKTLFQLSDKLRDEDLPKLGIKLEDKGKDQATFCFVDPAELLAEIEEKK